MRKNKSIGMHPERRVFGRKVGVNEICPCKFGQKSKTKFKHCCMDKYLVQPTIKKKAV